MRIEELDDLLEESLQLSEAGQIPEVISNNLDKDAALVASLVALAEVVRSTPPPLYAGQAESAARVRIVAAADQVRAKSRRPTLRWAWTFGLPQVAALSLFFLFLLVGTGFWLYGPIPAHAATLADLSGTVEIASGDSAYWHIASVGDLLYSDARIRTGKDGSATLAFFEGSRSTLGPESEISLVRVNGRWGDVLQVELSQQSGSVRYNIVPFNNRAAKFLVDTPSGSASVHGTVFAVTVDPLGQALFSVDRGRVVVDNADRQVSLTGGQATRSNPGEAPQPATFRFASNDTLTSVDDGTWSVAGVFFDVTKDTIITGDPQVGEPVIVRGRTVDEGQWVADAITPASDAGASSQLTGMVQSIDAGSWNINGVNVFTDEATVIGANIAVGDTVVVVYSIVNDDHWMALEIVKLGEENDGSETLCTGADPQPKGNELADQYDVPYEEIMSWFCQGFGFGEVDLAYDMSQEFSIPVGDVFALRQEGLGWGEIRNQLVLSTSTPTDVFTDTPTLDVTITFTPTVLPSDTLLSTETLTATTEILVSDTPTVIEITGCTSADPQPKGQTLADQYGVSYEEIMSWFCQGFGFGEIDIAYSLSSESGRPVSEFFDLKKSGLGWGQIKNLSDEAKNKGKDNGNNKEP